MKPKSPLIRWIKQFESTQGYNSGPRPREQLLLAAHLSGTWPQLNRVPEDTWSEICRERGYLLKRENPRGF
jgi:hypothetical protein